MDDDLIEALALFPETMWAGSHGSLDVASLVHLRMLAGVQPAVLTAGPMTPGDREKPVPYKFSMQGNIGVISVRGALVNSDSPYLRYYENVSGYPAIREAMIYAATHADVKGILLDIDSPGGAVNGVEDTGNLISQVNKLKPVWAFSGGAMCSGAYWFACGAKKVFAAKTAILGSIGVINTHMEFSKALEKEGVGVTQTRSGKYKALVSRYEPLSDAARAQIKAQVDHLYGVFIEHVASSRGVSRAVADEKMGQGREFIGDQAVEAGLADGIVSFDQVMSKFQSVLDKDSSSPQNVSHSLFRNTQMAAALTDQQIAAMQAGAVVAGAPAAQAAAVTTTAATTEAPAAAPAAPAATTTAAAAPAAPAATVAPDVVSVLTSQIAAKDQTILAANVELTNLRAQLATQTTSMAALSKIAAGSVRSMQIALGQSPADMAAWTPEQVVAAHAAAQPAFEKAFPVGGIAATAAAQIDTKTTQGTARAGISPLALAQATRINTPSK